MSAWLRAAAEDRMQRQAQAEKFESVEELRDFFAECDARAGEGPEPDWDQHRAVIDSSRRRGAADS
ncbi:MAG: hypothetical protein RIC56_17140 [Pseudomonadales bacterium]